MRRLLAGLVAFLGLAGLLLILPVYESPRPSPVPVETFAHAVSMGSFTAPARGAQLREGTTVPVPGVPESAPALTVTRTDAEGFSLVGVTWAYDPAVTDTVVQVRAQDGNGDWGEWTEIETEGLERTGAAGVAGLRGGTAPLWTGPSTGVEAELVTRAGAQPADVRIDLVDPGTSEADDALGEADIQDTADAAMGMPPVYSREQWGADPEIRSWGPEYASTIKAATLHHTADSNNYAAGDVPGIMRSIYRYHAVSLGWGDIGYNVIADKFGRLWEGRDGGLARATIGAHAGGFNTGTFGVSMLGNYDTVDTTQPMVNAVAAIIAWKLSLFGVDPQGRTTLVSGGGGTARYPKGASVSLPTIFGHRDVGSTACPGRYGYARLDEIRRKAAGLVAGAETPEITDHYESDSALRTLLGTKNGPEQSAAGVTWQTYDGGALFYSPVTGVALVRGAVLNRYLRAGGPASLGAPTLEERPLPDGRGVVADFERASIYWTATTDAHVVRGSIRRHWQSLGGPSGVLGYPLEDEAASVDAQGAFSVFERGTIMWSPATDAVVTSGGIRAAYENSGRETGPLGYPVDVETDIPGGLGRVQQFQRGAVYWSPASYGALVHGAIGQTWRAEGGAASALGLPAGNERSTTDGIGRFQPFERGSVYWSPATGAHSVRGGMFAAWARSGAAGGLTGYPTSPEVPTPDGRGQVQRFQSGSIYWTATTGAHLVRGAIGTTWLADGGTTGRLGYPRTDEADVPGRSARVQSFEDGAVYWSAVTGARAVRGDIGAAYDASGGATGVLGLPVGEAVPTPDGAGRVQAFQGGSVYWSAGNGAHVVRGAIGTTWLADGGTTGRLGHPRTDEADVPGRSARVQSFEDGAVYWSAVTGARIVRGDIGAAYDASGGATGVLGLPVGAAVPTPDGAGRVQAFQGGSVYWSAGNGAHVVRGAIGTTWLAAGGTKGRLGFPIGGEVPVADGAEQRFQGGTVTWTAATATTVARYS